MNIAFLGFGEAAPVLAAELISQGARVSAFDILVDDPAARDAQIAKTESVGVVPALSAPDAVREAELVISTVTASEAITAARMAKAGLTAGSVYLDINSVAPQTKAQIAEIAADQGAAFVEAVAMDTVPARGAQVPLLLCGPDAAHWVEKLNALGLNATSAGPDLGTASATKLIRSIFIKGLEALCVEAIESAGQLGIHDAVLASVESTYPQLDWQKLAGYQLSRAAIHGKRRAAEMRESASLVESLGVTPHMASAIAARMQDLADRNLADGYDGQTVRTFLDAIAAKAADQTET